MPRLGLSLVRLRMPTSHPRVSRLGLMLTLLRLWTRFTEAALAWPVRLGRFTVASFSFVPNLGPLRWIVHAAVLYVLFAVVVLIVLIVFVTDRLVFARIQARLRKTYEV